MPDIFALVGTPSLSRLRAPEIAIAVADDGDDAKGAAVERLGRIEKNLDVDLGVIAALDGRIKQRRPLPQQAGHESLQSLIQRGRRRLERERQGSSRELHDLRLDAVVRLRAELKA